MELASQTSEGLERPPLRGGRLNPHWGYGTPRTILEADSNRSVHACLSWRKQKGYYP